MSTPKKLTRREAALVRAAKRLGREEFASTARLKISLNGCPFVDASLADLKKLRSVQAGREMTSWWHTFIEVRNRLEVSLENL